MKNNNNKPASRALWARVLAIVLALLMVGSVATVVISLILAAL